MALTGNEIIFVQGVSDNGRPAATTEQTTTGAIAALANSEVTDTVNTAITTVGNGTLTAVGLAGGVISRSGPVAAFTDTTATAALIYAQIGSITDVAFLTRIKNTTAFAQTLSAGSGVTLPASVIIPANSVGTYLVTVNTSTTATFVHVQTVPLTTQTLEIITTLSTVGAGTITAAGIAGGITSRAGSQSAAPFTDTTDTAANIIAAQPNAHIGQSWEYTYQNTTNAVATLIGGTGVTVSGITAVNAGYSARYLVTYTAAATITMAGFSSGQSLASTQQSATFAGSTSGTTILKASGTAGSTTQTLPAVTGVIASTTGSNLYISDITRCTTQNDHTTSTTLTSIVGMLQTVIAGTYRIKIHLAGTAGASGGLKVAFKLTTAVITSWDMTSYAHTASAVAVAHTTTTTDETSLVASTSAVIGTIVEGTAVIGTGGTMQLEAAQNVSDGATTSVYVGSYMEFTRIA